MQPKHVAIIHDYFFTFGGAEKTVEAWLKLYPQAIIYTNFITLDNFRGTIFEKMYHSGQLRVTAEQQFLANKRPTLFKFLFWLHPIMARLGIKIESNTDLILISSVYSAKYVKLPIVPVIHYCHSPTRFLYPGMRTELNHDQFPWYLNIWITPLKWLLRHWDQQVVAKLRNPHTTWLTNSSYNQQVVEQTYGIKSGIVFPPVDLSRFAQTQRLPAEKQSGFIVYGRIVPIKKIERAIQACIATQQPLTIIGEASEKYIEELKQLLTTKRDRQLIRFAGPIDDTKKIQYLATTKAMLFPALEDFGIAPIEVIAAGVPVIALRGAGALEYIKPTINGIFFEQANTEEHIIGNLSQAIRDFDPSNWNAKSIQISVERFRDLHTTELKQIIAKLV